MAGEAYVVIDMLNDFMDPEGVLYCGDHCLHIIKPVRKALEKAREKDSLIVYTCDAHTENDLEFRLYPPHAIVGTEGAQIIDELEPFSINDIVVFKKSFSAFYETNFHDVLQKHEIHTLRLMGVCTNICVFCTAIDAVMRGYEVEIHKDEVASFDINGHKNALQQLVDIFQVKVLEE